jgi:hypothetical protein
MEIKSRTYKQFLKNCVFSAARDVNVKAGCQTVYSVLWEMVKKLCLIVE